MVAADSPAQLGGLLTGLAPGSRVAGYLLEKLVWAWAGRRRSSGRVMSGWAG